MLIRLVNYEACHVPLYHAWITSPDLMRATATDYVTLDQEYAYQKQWSTSPHYIRLIEADGVLVGDVNIFITTIDNHEQTGSVCVEGECNVMIAEEAYRRKGIAKEALKQAMASNNQINVFKAVIGKDNVPSQALFRSLGFTPVLADANSGEMRVEAWSNVTFYYFPRMQPIN